jgi:transposase
MRRKTNSPPSWRHAPDHLPGERHVIPAPETCPCCGSAKLSKLGGDITETLEVVPRQWKVIQTVRERFACRECETITQPPALFHVTPRGFAGPNLLAMILFEKFGQHQPLNRQSEQWDFNGGSMGVQRGINDGEASPVRRTGAKPSREHRWTGNSRSKSLSPRNALLPERPLWPAIRCCADRCCH